MHCICDSSSKEINVSVAKAVNYLEEKQLCFLYGTYFAVSGLVSAGRTYNNSESVRKAGSTVARLIAELPALPSVTIPPLARRPSCRAYTAKKTSFSEPRLLILTDPRTDHQPIKEVALGNILTIAFCDTDSPMRYVDIVYKRSLDLSHFLVKVVASENSPEPSILQVDLFFYREPEEAKEEEEEAALADYADYSAPALGGTDHWSSQFPDAQWKNEGVQAAIPDVPGATGWTADAGENLKFH
ncbi:hypothetical protein ACET3Z_024540 [Daucus carota]